MTRFEVGGWIRREEEREADRSGASKRWQARALHFKPSESCSYYIKKSQVGFWEPLRQQMVWATSLQQLNKATQKSPT